MQALVLFAVVGAAVWLMSRTAGTSVEVGYVNGAAVTLRLVDVGNGERLEEAAARDFLAMQEAAARAGHRLLSVSGFRTWAEQAALRTAYLEGRGNLAAAPGYSLHQCGRSVDIGGVGGFDSDAFAWLRANAPRFGFVNDVASEYWHWTHKET